MTLKFLLLGVFLSVMQAAPPIPRQTPNSSAGASSKIQKKASNKQAPSTTPLPPIDTDATPTPDNNRQSQSANNAEQSVVIRESVPVAVSTHRDWFDWGVWVFSGLLVVVGILQGVVLWQQRKIMGEHARHLENLAKAATNNAEAARLNAQAVEISNNQSAEFFRMEKRPWVGMSQELIMLESKTTEPGRYGFTIQYAVKNFGVAPAFNTVVCFGDTIDNPNDHAFVKTKVAEARQTAENIVHLTGDLLLPSAEKYNTHLFSERVRPKKFAIPGCIVYRFADGTVHYTELSYWIDLTEGEKATFRTLWFQSAN
jgi:hypothetical protein